MKKHLLLGLSLALTLCSFSQLTQGKITYSMTFSANSEEMTDAVAMMEGSRSETFFMPGKSRSEVYMGGLTQVTTIADKKSKKVLIMMDMLGTKYAAKTTVQELSEQNGPAETKVEILNETKVILGYTCTKAIVMIGGETPRTIEVWFTKDIEIYNISAGQGSYASEVPGAILESTLTENNMTVKMTATAIEKTADKNLFKLKAPKDYEKKTLAEMMGGN